jgi:hypothetical protein
MPDTSAIKIYSKRRAGLPAALVGSVFLVVGITALIGGLVRSPLDMAAFVISMVLGGFASLYGFYYVLTPVPLLALNASGLAYQAFPLVVYRVRWEDIEGIKAIKSRIWTAARGYIRNAELLLSIRLKPQAVPAYNGKTVFAWMLSYADLPIPPEEFVKHLRCFFPVEYLDYYDDLSLPH